MGLLGTIAKGAVAGAVGTLAMDALWYSRHRRHGGDQDVTDWEFTDADSVEEAGAPARFAETVTDVLGVEVPDEHAGTVNDTVHWLTGVANGIGHGLLHGRRNPLLGGAATGVSAFATSYGVLGALGVYEPIWEYEPETLRKDLGAHLVYGLATSLAHAALDAAGGNGQAATTTA